MKRASGPACAVSIGLSVGMTLGGVTAACSGQILQQALFGGPIETTLAEAASSMGGERLDRTLDRRDAGPAPRGLAPVRVRRVCSVNGGTLTLREPGTFVVRGPVDDPAYRVLDHRLLPEYTPKTWGRAAEPVSPIDVEVAAIARVRAMAEAGRRQRAIREAASLLAEAPESSRLWRVYGALLLSAGRLDEAARRLHEVYVVDPTLALEPMAAADWFAGGESELRRRALALRRMAERRATAERWVGAAVVSMWAGDAAGATDAIERSRALGADGLLCDRLAWGVTLSERDEGIVEGVEDRVDGEGGAG
ncbi:MAG: tetratricopeptide repeat protein [Planctomycetota bacterium]